MCLRRSLRRCRPGRLGLISEIARGMLFLVSHDASFIAGSTLSIIGEVFSRFVTKNEMELIETIRKASRDVDPKPTFELLWHLQELLSRRRPNAVAEVLSLGQEHRAKENKPSLSLFFRGI
jgi:hypothetical protein